MAACSCGGGPTRPSSPSRSSRSPRDSGSTAPWPRWATSPSSWVTSPRGLDRGQGRPLGNQPRGRPGHHPPGVARQPPAHRDRRPVRPAPVILAVTIAGLGADRGRRGQPRVLVVRRDLRLRAPAARARRTRWPEVMAAEETGVAGPFGRRCPRRGRLRGRRRPVRHRAQPGVGALGFRGIFALASCPSSACIALRSWVEEPRRFMVAEAAADHPTPVWGAVGRALSRPRDRLGRDRVRHLGRHRARQQLRVPLRARRPAPAGLGHGGDGRVSGVSGLLGLLAGRWLADHVGRRPTGHRRPGGHRVHGSARLHRFRARRTSLGYILGVLERRSARPRRGGDC